MHFRSHLLPMLIVVLKSNILQLLQYYSSIKANNECETGQWKLLPTLSLVYEQNWSLQEPTRNNASCLCSDRQIFWYPVSRFSWFLVNPRRVKLNPGIDQEIILYSMINYDLPASGFCFSQFRCFCSYFPNFYIPGSGFGSWSSLYCSYPTFQYFLFSHMPPQSGNGCPGGMYRMCSDHCAWAGQALATQFNKTQHNGFDI